MVEYPLTGWSFIASFRPADDQGGGGRPARTPGNDQTAGDYVIHNPLVVGTDVLRCIIEASVPPAGSGPAGVEPP